MINTLYFFSILKKSRFLDLMLDFFQKRDRISQHRGGMDIMDLTDGYAWDMSSALPVSVIFIYRYCNKSKH